MVVIWLAAVVVFAIAEALTVQLVTVWFAVGAGSALIATACGASTKIQIIVFVAVSLVTLLASRPFIKKFMKVKPVALNADRIIGQTGTVTAEIDNNKATGTVHAGGTEWTARSEDGKIIAEGSIIKVKAIEGVKLIVTEEENQ